MKIKKRTPAKQKILEILKREHKGSIKEIMEYFTISEIAVRRHLSDLEKKGYIQREITRQDIGRPYYTYQLTEKGHEIFPNKSEELLLEFLDDFESIQGKDAVNAVLAKRMEREKDHFHFHITAKDFDQRVKQFVELQNSTGFFIEYQKNENGDYELSNYHCPLLKIAEKYRQLCRNEKQVISDIFPQSHVKPTNCLAGEAPYCQWTITKPTRKE